MLISNGKILYTHKIIVLIVRLWKKRVFLLRMLPFVGKYMKVVRLSIYWTLETCKTFLSLLSNMVEKLKRLKVVCSMFPSICSYIFVPFHYNVMAA